MIVSRRSYLMSKPSAMLMRAAGRASTPKPVDPAQAEAHRRFGELLQRTGASADPDPVYLPPTLYAAAQREGYDMRGYRVTQPIPTR